MSRLALGSIQPPIQWVPGSLSLGVKWPGLEADNSPPYSAKVKNGGAIPRLPQYALMVWCSVKAQEQICLYIYIIYFSLLISHLDLFKGFFINICLVTLYTVL